MTALCQHFTSKYLKIVGTDKYKLVQQKPTWNSAGCHRDISCSCESNDWKILEDLLRVCCASLRF